MEGGTGGGFFEFVEAHGSGSYRELLGFLR
jgi:hypothetical protein